MANGTFSTLDSLAANSTSQTVVAFGEDRLWGDIDANVRVANENLREALDDLVEITGDRQRRYGGLDEMTMEDLDQWGRPTPQKITAGSNVGFPMRLKGGSLQWTRKYMEIATVTEVVKQAQALLAADRKAVLTEIQRAVFVPTNYLFTDVLIDNVDLAIKRLVNADSAPIPIGPNGETFDAATHTHYLARVAALAATDISGLIDTVAEHYNTGQVFLYINKAQESAVRGFTSNFTPYTDPRIAIFPTTTSVTVKTVNIMDVGNRAIGIFDEAEVWVKPWIPANYMFAFVRGQERPLVLRERFAGRGDLRLVAEDEKYPLRARSYEREFGVAVWARTNGAVLYVGGTVYTAPTL